MSTPKNPKVEELEGYISPFRFWAGLGVTPIIALAALSSFALLYADNRYEPIGKVDISIAKNELRKLEKKQEIYGTTVMSDLEKSLMIDYRADIEDFKAKKK